MAVILSIAVAGPAHGHDPSSDTEVGTAAGAFKAGSTQTTSGKPKKDPSKKLSDGPARTDRGRWIEVGVQCQRGGNQTCDDVALCDDGSVMKHEDYVLADGTIADTRTSCPVEDPKDPTPADVAAAFEKIPMTPSPLHIQPPQGETLVNFDTIFFTDATSIDKQVTVLDATVDFHITAASYTWHYGDDTSTTSATPGAAYPHQTIVHRYLRKGAVAVSLDTTYQADYRINGGPQQHLAETVTVAGAPQQLTVLTATPHLVGN